MDSGKIVRIVEAALMAADRPLDVDALQGVFGDFARPDRKAIREAVKALQEAYTDHAMEIKEVASGFRIQVRTRYTEFISRLWEEKPPRYSRALMETLALIAYRQPITRGEIEEVRGVSVSTNIVRTLMERAWIRVVGHRDVPGRPAMFGTTKEFLDYFGLRKLEDLPTLEEIRDLDEVSTQLELPTGDTGDAASVMTDDEAAQDAPETAETDADQDVAPPRMRLVRAAVAGQPTGAAGPDSAEQDGEKLAEETAASPESPEESVRADPAQGGDQVVKETSRPDSDIRAEGESERPAEEAEATPRDLARQS